MTQPTALFLADVLEDAGKPADITDAAVAELRRLHAENAAASTHLAELMKDLVKVETQRDALLEALKKLDNFFETYRPEDHPVSDPHELVRAAIKKAEENT